MEEHVVVADRDALDSVRDGTIGFFWPSQGAVPDLNEDTPVRGHIRLDGPLARIETLVEDVEQEWFDFDTDSDRPVAVVGLTPTTALLMLEIAGPYSTRSFGTRASTNSYRARTVVGCDVSLLSAVQPLGLHAHFEEIGNWAGLPSTVERGTENPDGTMSSWTVEVAGGEPSESALGSGRALRIDSHWSVSGTSSRRVVGSAVTIGCIGTRSRDPWELLQPLLQIQNLLNLAFGGFVAAAGGSADLVINADRRLPKPWLWNGALMHIPAGAAPAKMTEIPLFTLETLGGTSALRRWVNVERAHPRAVAPVVGVYRNGPGSAGQTILEVAAGIEYWVKSHRPAQWARPNRFATALAGRVGRSFSEWVGDPEAWAAAFWLANNQLKHEPTLVPDPNDLADLAISGRLLLTAAILDKVAASKKASSEVFRHHRYLALRERLRSRFA
jgi:hypothetical protein